MRVVLTGAAGRLGAVLCGELASAGHEVLALGRKDLDITCAAQVTTALDRLRPQALINCASYNAVDAAETDRAAAFALNADGPALLAAAADRVGAVFVHFSSDFVFDGEARDAYTETHEANPVNVYGLSKLAGEAASRRLSRRHYILRLSSLFGGVGLNGHRATVDYLADGILAGKVVRAAVDRIVTPSYAPDVARATVALLRFDPGYGTYHCVNSRLTTWHGLAQEIARQLGVNACIEPVGAADLTTIARRPRFAALANRKLASVGIAMPRWQSAIRRHLISRHGSVAAIDNPSSRGQEMDRHVG